MSFIQVLVISNEARPNGTLAADPALKPVCDLLRGKAPKEVMILSLRVSHWLEADASLSGQVCAFTIKTLYL